MDWRDAGETRQGASIGYACIVAVLVVKSDVSCSEALYLVNATMRGTRYSANRNNAGELASGGAVGGGFDSINLKLL